MSWLAGEDDILIADMAFGNDLDRSKFLDSAEDEISIALAKHYELPLPSDVGVRGNLLLKKIHSHLASGRLIMAMTMDSEDKDLQQYGLYLIKEAMADLDRVGSQISLEGTTPVTPAGATGTTPDDPDLGLLGRRVPGIINADSISPWDAYEDFAHHGHRYESTKRYYPGVPASIPAAES